MLHQLPSFDVSHRQRSHLGETAGSLWGTSSIKRRIVLESRNAFFRQIKAGFMGVSWLCHCFKRLSSPGTWNERWPEKHVLSVLLHLFQLGKWGIFFPIPPSPHPLHWWEIWCHPTGMCNPSIPPTLLHPGACKVQNLWESLVPWWFKKKGENKRERVALPTSQMWLKASPHYFKIW